MLAAAGRLRDVSRMGRKGQQHAGHAWRLLLGASGQKVKVRRRAPPRKHVGMKISVSRKEFTRLLELAYMGEWVATAMDADTRNSYLKRYHDVMQKLYKLAAEEEDGCPEYVDEAGHESGLYDPSERLETNSPAANALEKFTNDTFWEELISRMAERDYQREITRDPLPSSTAPDDMLEHQIKREEQLEDRYRAEFVKNDLDNIFVMFGADRLS